MCLGLQHFKCIYRYVSAIINFLIINANYSQIATDMYVNNNHIVCIRNSENSTLSAKITVLIKIYFFFHFLFSIDHVKLKGTVNQQNKKKIMKTEDKT